MKGIVLAGGCGSRLYPATRAIPKSLLPVYDKPMIYYPLDTLAKGGINEILVITTPAQLPLFKAQLTVGYMPFVGLEFAVQAHPGGIAEALIIGNDFVGNESVVLILGDNIFHGSEVSKLLREALNAADTDDNATIFAYPCALPQSYGVVEITDGRVASIEEKPERPRSDLAVTGLYVYPADFGVAAADLKPSARSELEITDVNNWYRIHGRLRAAVLGPGVTWFDAGTFDDLLRASNFMQLYRQTHPRT